MANVQKFIRVALGVVASFSLACRQEPAVHVAGAGSAGAGGTQFPAGPTRPAPTIQLEPADLATATGQTPLQIRVSNLGSPVGAALLGQIAATITLKTWPGMVDIPVTASKIVDAVGSSDQDEFAHIYLERAPTSC